MPFPGGAGYYMGLLLFLRVTCPIGRWFREPHPISNSQSMASGVGVPTPCGAVPTRGTAFVAGVLEL